MPTKVERWSCNVCKNVYGSEEEALRCEATGDPIEYPVGTIFGYHKDRSMYHDITFAIAKNRIDGHYSSPVSWACRDNGAGDSLDNETCESYPKKDYSNILDREAPHFKRMVEYLKSKGIKPLIWDGEKAVAL